MSTNDLLPGLSLFTIIIILAILSASLIFFLRKRRNRHPMDTPAGRAADDQRRRDAEADRRDP